MTVIRMEERSDKIHVLFFFSPSFLLWKQTNMSTRFQERCGGTCGNNFKLASALNTEHG
jgi:hypothetical protein